MKSIKRVSSIVTILLLLGCSSQKAELQTQSISDISNSTKSELEERKTKMKS